MLGTCADCKFWGTAPGDDDHVGWEGRGIGFRRCSGVRERWMIGEQYKPLEDYDEEIARRSRELTAARAYVEDGSEYMASLVTGPDFGCALFERAAASNPNTESQAGA